MQIGNDVSHHLGPTAIVGGGCLSGRRGTEIVGQQNAKAVIGKKPHLQPAERKIGRARSTQENDSRGSLMGAINRARNGFAVAHEGFILHRKRLCPQSGGGQREQSKDDQPAKRHLRAP